MGIAVKSSKIITLSDKVVVKQRSTNVEYGYLYNWYAVNNAHVLAPTGWHVPTTTERDTLVAYLINNGYGYGGSGQDIAKSMASKTGWNASSTEGQVGNNPSINNSSGLNISPSGYRLYDGTFYSIGEYGFICYSNEYNSTTYFITRLYSDDGWVLGYTTSKSTGTQVRFVRDNDTGWNGQKLMDIDGNIYDTVKIGTQIWTCQNAAMEHYKDGTAIPLITDNTAWSNDTTGARCAYNNDNSYVFL